jgi:hypothetical protein
MVKAGRFPAPRRLAADAVGWLEADVDTWLTTRGVFVPQHRARRFERYTRARAGRVLMKSRIARSRRTLAIQIRPEIATQSRRELPHAARDHHVVFARPAVFTFACALRRSSQYFFILWESARLAAADI